MSQASTIEWTDATWNPITGCDRVSPGCKHCYALDLAARLKAMGQKRYQRDGTPPTSGPGFGLTLHPDKLDEPLRWRKPRMVFVNSMSDLFHPEVPSRFINAVWMTMFNARQHTFQVLTKRPERMRDWTVACLRAKGWPPDDDLWGPNVWLGTSIELNTYARRADAVREIPGPMHRKFISAEPLLGPLPDLDLTGIHWLIAGGESGPQHRPIDAGWVRDLRDRALDAGVAFFFKQWGGRTAKAGGRELDGRTWDEFPETLPAVAA
jgi:protein gp37